MITISDLSISFSGVPLFEEADFIINYGDKVGLVGRNGSGKSTFFKLLLGKLTPDEGKIDISSGYSIGHLDQHIKFTHATAIEEVCSILPLEREHEGWKGEQILEGLGFTSQQFEQNPSEFSGGYQVKLNLAKILLNEPDMLLLDEPTNYLDIYSIRWLGKFLKKWKGELVLITHDRAFMDSIINNTLIIHRNRFRKMSGNTRKMIEQIAKEEEVYESTRVREEKEREKTEAWIQRFGAKASMASRVKSREKMLDKQEVKVKLGDIKSLSFKFNYLPYTSKEFMVQLKNISFGYEPDKMLVKDLSFNIENGDKICIIGRNGNGKSTLLKLIHGEIQPQIGEITSYNKTAQGYFGQMNIEQLDPKLNIVEEIASVNSKLEETMVRRVCASMMFAGDTAFKKIGVLSGGEKSRVMLGKIVVTPVNLLLLDEPTNHFDMESSETLMEAIKNFEGAVIMVTHNEYFLHEVATKLIVFDGGKTFYFEGGYADFLKKIGWAE